MSLDSIKRDLKDYIEENKASLEAWENVTYLTKKDGTPFKSMSKNFTNATYKRKESFRGYILEVDTKFTKLSKKYQKKSKAQKGLSNH